MWTVPFGLRSRGLVSRCCVGDGGASSGGETGKWSAGPGQEERKETGPSPRPGGTLEAVSELLVTEVPQVSCVNRIPIFSALSSDEKALVAQLAWPVTLPGGVLLDDVGRGRGQLFVIRSGSVRVWDAPAEGASAVPRTVGPGGVVGEDAFLSGGRLGSRAETVGTTRVVVFRHSDFQMLLAGHPDLEGDLTGV